LGNDKKLTTLFEISYEEVNLFNNDNIPTIISQTDKSNRNKSNRNCENQIESNLFQFGLDYIFTKPKIERTEQNQPNSPCVPIYLFIFYLTHLLRK